MVVLLSVISTILSIIWCVLITPVLTILAMSAVSAMGGTKVPLIARIFMSGAVIIAGLWAYIGMPVLIFHLI